MKGVLRTGLLMGSVRVLKGICAGALEFRVPL